MEDSSIESFLYFFKLFRTTVYQLIDNSNYSFLGSRCKTMIDTDMTVSTFKAIKKIEMKRVGEVLWSVIQ